MGGVSCKVITRTSRKFGSQSAAFQSAGQASPAIAEAGFAAALEDQAIRVSLTGNADAAAGIIGRGLVEAGLEVFELSRRRRSLEDLFAEAEANQREMAA